MQQLIFKKKIIPGSGPLGRLVQIVWFGHPSQALALPADSLSVPGQSEKDKNNCLQSSLKRFHLSRLQDGNWSSKNF